MSISEQLKEKRASVEEALKYAEQKISVLPDGLLLVRKNGNKTRYYRKDPETGTETYISSKDTEALKILQERAYYLEIRKTADKELLILKSIQKAVDNMPDFERVFFSIPENRRSLIEPYSSPQIEKIRKEIEQECKMWLKDHNRKSVERGIQLVSLNGERVRSKSELIIADRLRNAEIPYCYERQYAFINPEIQDFEVWFPDFQMFNKRTGAKFYWEHFGLMDNPDYCASCQFKIETYAKHGIIQGKNFIISMESSKHSLSTEYVDCLINEFLK